LGNIRRSDRRHRDVPIHCDRRCLWRDGIGKAALLAVVIAAAAPGYRFLIFLVTLYYT
jgi:hypothetical protein